MKFEAGTGNTVAETVPSFLYVSSLYNLRRYGRRFNFSLTVGTVLLLLNVVGLIVYGTTRHDFRSFTFKIITVSIHWKIIRLCRSLVG